MNKYCVLLPDIDGTLTDSRNEISPNTKNLLNRLHKKQIPVVFASERSPGGVEAVARQTEVRAPAICYGGALVLDENRAILTDEGIAPADALAFKSFVNARFPEISLHSYIYDIWLTDGAEDEWTRRLKEAAGGEPLAGDLASALRTAKRVHKFLCAGRSRNVGALREAAEREFPSLSFALSDSTYLEVVRKGVSKCSAMRTIQRYYNVGAAEIVAVGDSYADAEMLREAGMGIAMGNAPEGVKSAAKRVTATNDDEGAYIAVKRLRFRPPERPAEKI